MKIANRKMQIECVAAFAIAAFALIATAAEPQKTPPSYLVECRLCFGEPPSNGKPGKVVKVLASPRLLVLEGYKAVVALGDPIKVAGESTCIGSNLTLRIDPAANGKVRVNFVLERSERKDDRSDAAIATVESIKVLGVKDVTPGHERVAAQSENDGGCYQVGRKSDSADEGEKIVTKPIQHGTMKVWAEVTVRQLDVAQS
jgi:hypothetical protein